MYIGIDLGTSGVRACAIDEQAQMLALCAESIEAPINNGNAVVQQPKLWWQAVESVLTQLLGKIDGNTVKAITVDGTSGTLLATDAQCEPLGPALMYNDAQCLQQAELITSVAPRDSAAHGASSGLAKLLYLQEQYPEATHIFHQADWIVSKLGKTVGISDENNALKTGYDPLTKKWPDWLDQLKVKRHLLPKVVPPGMVIGEISTHIAKKYKVSNAAKIISGTTDSIAAFIATGVQHPGEAVTSLGSTLVLKIISETPVYSAEYGVYSHKLGDYWLAGGASNVGGAIFKRYFTEQQLTEMSANINTEKSTGLDYYPLTKPGERFPVNDPGLAPRLEPRPEDDCVFFQGLLECMSRIEHEGYKKLHELGAPYPVSVHTAGGGSKNIAWTMIRQKQLAVPIHQTQHTDACYGSALLAKRATG